ncbi:2-dehydro-3-deoxygluconokinase [Blastomonas natatoria]|uniref:2-dehydro-3-deoxygluconokinase n=1 Tax=Blastomonas natatoria TaxID=34015 RepID=A0A2V3V8Q1_9SPHN|nr:sugar kinase [Blastomonas natatoria]PXW77544.1 2-dehydro-3-deoxygluconokinase [Blastomonas natatoria]
MRIVLIGEAMLELSQRGEHWHMGHGGDTLNTALHLARAGHDVGFLTALGSDPLSAGLIDRWRAEGLDTALVLHHPDRSTGLYAISTDDRGERSFAYWRDQSAARAMFALPDAARALDQAAQADMIAFSLITLAILPPQGREALYALARSVRQRGGQVAFDGNYRARLWADGAEALEERDHAIALATLGLPTLDDEVLLSGETDADAVAAHWQALGCSETVVKLGERGCRLADGAIAAPPEILDPVDTSGAGDAFNAGYLGARMKGATPVEAAQAGHVLAGWTVMRPGAIPDRDP